MLNSRLLVIRVFGAAGATARTRADGARRTTPVRTRWCTRRAVVTGGRRRGTKAWVRATTSFECADAAVRTSEARPPAGTGRSATTRPAAPPKAGNTGVGPFWTTPAGSRKIQSDTPSPAAKAAGTAGEKSANARLMLD